MWAKHLFGKHTLVDIESWVEIGEIKEVTIIGRLCWRCPHKTT